MKRSLKERDRAREIEENEKRRGAPNEAFKAWSSERLECRDMLLFKSS